MPELPEVEVVKRGLLNHLPGRTITDFRSDGKSLRKPVPEKRMRNYLVGAKITDVSRRAKYLLIELDNEAIMILHLGMTGTLGLFEKNSQTLTHDHVCFCLDNYYEMRFNDVRRFGSIIIASPKETKDLENTVFKTTGPEPFDQIFSGKYLKELARDRTQPVKSFIMDSRVVAGIGNIYANESLFGAGIRPAKKIGAISLKKYNILVDEIRRVLQRAIECGGSTISDFLSASGESGYFQVHFNVYGKNGAPCPRCSATIKQVKLGGRASFFCPICQR